MVRDPVCGMEVSPESAPSVEVAGRTFHFCGRGCKDSFEAELAAGGTLLGDPSAIPCRHGHEDAATGHPGRGGVR